MQHSQSLFYPCEAPASSAQDGCIPWVVGPLAAIVQGYSRFLGKLAPLPQMLPLSLVRRTDIRALHQEYLKSS